MRMQVTSIDSFLGLYMYIYITLENCLLMFSFSCGVVSLPFCLIHSLELKVAICVRDVCKHIGVVNVVYS